MMGTEEPKSFPVRYMVVNPSLTVYLVIDTGSHCGDEVCECRDAWYAHRIAKLMNEAEGYRYGNQES